MGTRSTLGTVLLASVLTGPASAQDDGQWLLPGKDFGATRYSSVAQFTAGNAGAVFLSISNGWACGGPLADSTIWQQIACLQTRPVIRVVPTVAWDDADTVNDRP